MDQRRDTCWPARPSWDPLTVYAAIVGTDEAQMWEEAGTDEIDEWGHENFDTSWTSTLVPYMKLKGELTFVM